MKLQQSLTAQKRKPGDFEVELFASHDGRAISDSRKMALEGRYELPASR